MATHYITFTYSATGGTGAPGTQTFTCATARYPRTFTATISSVKPTRAYYSFLGWSTTAGSSTASYASGQTLSFTFSTSTQGDVTRNFYAVWKRNTAYVYYNANGGTGAPSTQSHNAGTSVALSGTKPTRAGYIFIGWSTSATATAKQYDAGQANVPLYTTTTLYAVWKTAASSLSASNGDLGDALTITITREVNTYTDTITWAFGTQSGTIATKTSAGSVSWTPAVSLASEFPNSASGPCVLTCTTYNGDTLIGTTTKTITLTVPQSLAPTVSVSYADTIAQCLTWGIFVQSRSKLAFTITASGQQGATIASYSTSVNGTSYNSATFTTDVLLYNGTNTYTVTVTDSRGLKTVSTGTFSVVAYSNPSLTLTLCDRNDSDSEQVDIGFDFAVSPVSNNNDANYRLDYKLKSASTWTNGTVQSLGAYSGSISDLIANLDGGDEWDIRINVIDSFQTSSVESEVGVSGNILLNSRHQGGLGLLMKSQADNQLDIGKPTVHHGAVLEQFGSSVATHSASGNYAKVVTFESSGSNVTAPITLEYIRKSDNGSVRITIRFNSSFGLDSFTKDASADVYLYNANSTTWELYVGKASSSDSVEVFDFHNPWSNTDLMVEWGDTSISTLPTGYESATPINTVISEAPSGVSVASASWKTTASITLPRGIWVLSAYIQFNSNTTGIRSAVLSESQDSGTSTRNMSSDTSAAMTSGNATKLHFVDIYQIASETTYYLNAYQNCGSALTIYGRITAIKIV